MRACCCWRLHTQCPESQGLIDRSDVGACTSTGCSSLLLIAAGRRGKQAAVAAAAAEFVIEAQAQSAAAIL